MTTEIAIAGAGNLGRLLYDCVDGDDRWKVVAFIDDGLANQKCFGLPIYSCDAYHPTIAKSVLMAIGFPAMRRQMLSRLAPHRLDWPTFVDRRSIVGKDARIGEGTIVLSFAFIASGVDLGAFSYVSPYAAIGAGAKVGQFASILTGAVIGGSIIGDDCVLGAKSACLDDSKMGDGARLGPAAVLRGASAAAGSLVSASPSRVSNQRPSSI